jgi:hypothetical protein
MPWSQSLILDAWAIFAEPNRGTHLPTTKHPEAPATSLIQLGEMLRERESHFLLRSPTTPDEHCGSFSNIS